MEKWQTGERPVVLIIDDHDALRVVVKRALEAVHLAVISSDNAPEALELLAARPVSVVITDISMPQMDGWEFCERAHALYPEVVLGIMTGWDPADEVRLASHGVSFVVPKPFNVRELQGQVLTALDERSHLQPPS